MNAKVTIIIETKKVHTKLSNLDSFWNFGEVTILK